jgi:Caspase domain
MTKYPFILMLIWAFCCQNSSAQILDYSKMVVVDLDSVTPVTLYGVADNDRDYYYVPFSKLFQLSKNQSGTPEFLFSRYVSDDKKGSSGGVLHCIVTWSELSFMRDSLQAHLNHKIPNTVLKGPVPLQFDAKFFLVSSPNSAGNGTIASGKAPLLPGAKAVVAAQFEPDKAKLLWELFKQGEHSDLSLIFEYNIQFKPITSDARLIIDWDKFRKAFESYSNLIQTSTQPVSEGFQFLLNRGIVETKDFGQGQAAKTNEAYAQNFMFKYLHGLRANSLQINRQARQEVSLAAVNTDFTMPFQAVINVGSWYKQIKNHPGFNSVNLNDPFFKEQRIQAVLDIEAAKVFEKNGANYVLLSIKKDRKSTTPFRDQIVIDKTGIAKRGLIWEISYATGTEKDTFGFQYQIQWSLAGGLVYPAVPLWNTSNMPAITIAAPAKEQEVIVEASGPAFENPKISRIVAEIRYKLLGVQKTETMLLRVGEKGGAIATKTIFCDKENEDLEYRYHFFHREKERIVSNWQKAEGIFFLMPALPASFQTESSAPSILEAAPVPPAPSVADANRKIIRQNKDYALFFAVSDYQSDSTYADLQNPVKDAEALSQELTQRYGFRTEVLKNPTRSQIKAKVEEYSKKFETKDFDPEGQLLIFFSGHGEFSDGNGFFLPSDARPDDLEATAIAYPIWRTRIDQMACKHILIVIDACFSGAFDATVAMRGGPSKRPGELTDAEKFYQEHLARTTRLYMTSGGKEKTPDKSGFSKKLLEGLRTADTPNNLLTAGQLFESYVKQIRPVPLFGEFGKDEAGSSFVFVKR